VLISFILNSLRIFAHNNQYLLARDTDY